MKRLARLAHAFGLARALCLLLLVALVALRVWDPPPIEELRLRTFDYFQVMRPRVADRRPVVILDIDEASLKELGQWPWPRTLIADIVTRLTALGAVAIGFDVVFPEADRMSPANAAQSIRELDDDTRAKLRGLESNDEVLARAFRNSRVVVGRAGAARAAEPRAGEEALQTGFAMRGPDARPFLVTFPGILRNVAELEQAAAGRGVFTIRPERDGIVRRVPLAMVAQDTIVPALTLEMLRVVTGAGAIFVRTDPNGAGVQSVSLPGLDIPTDRNGQLWLHFSPHHPARFVSAVDVLRGRIGRERIAGKLVLVGTSAIGLLDLKTTPVDRVMAGVEVHAQILESVLGKSVLAYPNWAPGAEVIGAVVFGLGIIAATPVLGAVPAFILGGAVAAALAGASWYWFIEHDIMVDTTYALGSTALLYITLVFVNYFREQKQRQRIRSAFGYYLSPTLVEDLARSPEKLVLGGELRRMTVMFNDVRGFTTISEYYKSDPQQLTSLMNRYLTPMTDAIIARKGTIDKYIGDSIMAFWNAPLDDPDQEANACDAALDMLARLEILNDEFKREAQATGGRYLPFNIGIGINTGACVVGNMGSDLRFNYSVLGDTVNLAARLEGRSKDYGLQIVLGGAVAAAVADRFAVLEIDRIRVKGKYEPEAVFTVLGRDELRQSQGFSELRGLNEEMTALYRQQNWTGALAAIESCRAAAQGLALETLYDVYVARIEAFRRSPPPPDWDGVYAYETK
ncbi:MAG: adenylate/guanylate cyclase domain-containing protein [Proteobacteria bacterium]|nr:adenylate/guanylate cyclase domain-containing protein [Pseudomonadota bacterium]